MTWLERLKRRMPRRWCKEVKAMTARTREAERRLELALARSGPLRPDRRQRQPPRLAVVRDR